MLLLYNDNATLNPPACSRVLACFSVGFAHLLQTKCEKLRASHDASCSVQIETPCLLKNVPLLNHWLCRQVAECLAQGYYQKDKNNARLRCCNGCWDKLWLPVCSSTLTVAAHGTGMTKHTHTYAHARMEHSRHQPQYACTRTVMGPDKYFKKNKQTKPTTTQEKDLRIKMEPLWTSNIYRDGTCVGV